MIWESEREKRRVQFREIRIMGSWKAHGNHRQERLLMIRSKNMVGPTTPLVNVDGDDRITEGRIRDVQILDPMPISMFPGEATLESMFTIEYNDTGGVYHGRDGDRTV